MVNSIKVNYDRKGLLLSDENTCRNANHCDILPRDIICETLSSCPALELNEVKNSRV